jgi:D-alanyl-D-alanine carboxypeptidase
VKAGQKRSTYKIYSQNKLLLHGYDGTIGGKTGFTSLAHRTFWGAATRDGHTLVVTLFQIKDPTEKAARALLDWGFANVGKVTPVGKLVEPGELTPTSPSPSPTAVASAPATSGGTSAAGTSPSGSRFSVPWLPVGLVVVVLAALGLWWRRRSGAAAPWQSLPDDSAVAAATVLPAPAPAAARPAAQRTSSVVVTTPVQRTPAGTVSPEISPSPAPMPLDPDDTTGPVPVVVDPVAAAPTVTPPEPTTPDGTSPGVTPPAAAPPSPGGHVRIIRPPSRPS